MAVAQSGVRFDQIAKKWHALAQRRLAHVRELERSGRWKYFYSEERFGLYLRETERVAALWAKARGDPVCRATWRKFNASGPLEMRVTAAPSSAI